MHPAAETDLLSDLGASKGTTAMCAEESTGQRWAVGQERLGVNGDVINVMIASS
jgi:hypothetical protein